MLNLPNLLTLCNLLFGCAAMIFLANGDYRLVMICLICAAIADVFDGMAARALKITGDLGKELDSIADMVSFGFIPGAIAYVLLLAAFQDNPALPVEMIWDWRAFPGFLITAFSGLRLAKFNLDTRQSDSFLGLPTPSATYFMLGLLMIASSNFQAWNSWLLNPLTIYITIGGISTLLISELPMFGLKFKKFGWKGNELQFTFMAFGLIMLVWLRENSFAIVVFVYVLVAIVRALFFRSSKTTA